METKKVNPNTKTDRAINYCSQEIDEFMDYKSLVGNKKVCTPEEESEYILKIKNGDENALQEFILKNQGLVIMFAKKYQNISSFSLLDLIQEGNVGLIKAVMNYDIDCDAKFSVYASYWIKKEIIRSIETCGNLIRIPANTYKKCISAYSKASLNKVKTGEEITVNSLQQSIGTEGVNQKIIKDALTAFYNNKTYSSLESGTLSDKTGSYVELAETIEDLNEEHNPNLATDQNYINKTIKDIVKTLSEREREILTMRYGLSGTEPMSLAEVSNHCGLSREGVRKIEKKALQKIKEGYPHLQEYVM